MKRFALTGATLALAVALTGLGQAQDPAQAPSPNPNGADELPPALKAALEAAKAAVPQTGAIEKKYRDFAEVTKGAQKFDGLFTLYQKDDHLYAEIKPHQFNQPLIVPIMVSRGVAMAGNPLNFGDEWVILFKKVGERVQVVRRNVKYKAPSGTPLEKAVQQNYTDSVIQAVPIVSVNPAGGMSTLIDFSDIFLGDFGQLGLGVPDRSRTNWHKVKAYPNNLELQVEATFGMGGRMGRGGMGGDDGVADPRGVTLVVHYSLIKVPDGGYRVRVADNRVGHFLNATKDYGLADVDNDFVRMVNRWRLEKADPRAKLSPPKKQIVWWVEETVPHEYRPFVEEGIREWNKAFEKIGFREAIAVRWQQAGDEFDPEDTNYCTFKWITTGRTYAMSCLRSNPLTGEMIDGDVIFDASWIKHWKAEYALLVGGGTAAELRDEPETIGLAEVISPILADRKGYGLPGLSPRIKADGQLVEAVPANWTPLQRHLMERFSNGSLNMCQYQGGMHAEMALAGLVLAEQGKTEPGGALPDEYLGQAIKEVVMHEVGHSLGLRHNFKASTMLTADQLNDTSITRVKGLVGSVMDYSPVNLAPKGKWQGDFYSTTIGPYDYWAIEYAYKPIDGDEATELKKIGARAPEPDLVFATDEDMMGNHDPRVNTYDIGSDVCQFAKDRMDLAASLLKDLDAKVVKDGDSYARNRRAFQILLSQYGNGAALISAYIGGQSVHRDHKGDKDARDPIVPVPGDKQRECLNELVGRVLSDKAFAFSPATLRRLGVEKWYHWGSNPMGVSVDFPVLERVLSIQRIALDECLSPGTLGRLQTQQLQADGGPKPLEIAEVFQSLTGGIWSDLAPSGEGKDRKVSLSTIRRNLQREHLKRLNTIVLGERRGGGMVSLDGLGFLTMSGGSGAYPADARALARLHLKKIGEIIDASLGAKDATIDDTTRAHLEECRFKIGKVLDAGLQISDL
jgi:hypothetical protein